LFEPNTIYEQITYIPNNPVGRELCETPEDRTWSSAADYSGVRIGPLRVDRESLPPIVKAED
jgi:hypothetical protein